MHVHAHTHAHTGGQQAASSESSGAALVFVPNGKESRTKDEEKMKTLKWNFNQPRSEHINQLKEQLQPCVSAALFSQLFHDDFKQHIAALATLTKVGHSSVDNLISQLLSFLIVYYPR